MKDLRTITEICGLSDEELATILCVSKGTIYNSKRKISPLPTAAGIKLADIQKGLEDPEKMELATRILREREIQKVDVIILNRQARLHKLNTVIKNKEIKATDMIHSFDKRLLALKCRYLGIELNEKDKNVSELQLKNQRTELLNSTAQFQLHGPSQILELSLDIELLKTQQAALINQIEKLQIKVKQIKELPFAEWPLLDSSVE